jgi:hypothetical protein
VSPRKTKSRRAVKHDGSLLGWSTSLAIVQDGSRFGFAQFKLCAHLLYLRGLLFQRCRETCDSAFQLLDFFVLL